MEVTVDNAPLQVQRRRCLILTSDCLTYQGDSRWSVPWTSICAYTTLFGSLVVFALIHLPFITVEFSSDEGDNLVGGWLMSEGQVIYRDYFSQHTPFGHFYAALTTLLFGRNWVIQRYSATFLGLICLGYLMARLVKSPSRTFFYAVALFVLLWPIYSLPYLGYMLLNDNLAAYPYLLCFALIANSVWHRVPLSRTDHALLGIAAYVAVMSNPFILFPALVLVPMYVYSIFWARAEGTSPLSSGFSSLTWALAGSVGPLALTIGYFLVTNSLSEAWFWVIDFNQTIYAQYGGCPASIWPEWQRQIVTLLDVAGDIGWSRRAWFGYPMFIGKVEDTWMYLGLVGRIAILVLSFYWLATRRKLLGMTLFLFAAASLLRSNTGMHVQHFRMLELLAETLLVVLSIRVLLRSKSWLRIWALAPIGVLAVVQVIVASRSWATLKEIHRQHPIRLTLHPKGLPMTGGGEHLRNIAGDDGKLLTYPVYYQFNYMSGCKPASYFYACVPWTLHRPEDRQRYLDDLHRAASENTVLLIDHCGSIWNLPFADLADELLCAVEEDYVEIEPGIHVSRSNPQSHRPPLCKELLPPEPTELKEMLWVDGVAEGEGEHPRMIYTLDEAALVYRVEIRFVLKTPDGEPAKLQAWWRKRGDNEFEGPGRGSFVTTQPSAPEEHILCIPIGQTIDQLRIEPNNGSCQFEVRSVRVVKWKP